MRFSIASPAHRAFDENETTLRIAAAARKLFIETGGTGLSIRQVAQAAGMSVGAVQHFYPRRDELVAALLEFVVNQYEVGYEQILAKLPFNGEARLLALMEYMATDLRNQETRSFFYSLWALGSHNATAAALVDAMYRHHCNNLASFVGAARPALSEDQCLRAALQISAVLDGMMVFTAPGSAYIASRDALLAILQDTVRKLLD